MATKILQPADGVDTFIFGGDATTNYGGNTNIFVGGLTGSNIYRTLIKFDGLSDGTIPSAATISSATLSLYCSGENSSNARTLRVFRLKRAWVEAQATWNIYSTGNKWQTAGGFGANDCEQTDIGSRAFSATETTGEYKDFSLTVADIQAIVNGTWTNNGFLIKADTESSDRYSFYSSDNASNKPKLTIVYTTGPAGVKTINGVAIASVKTINGIAIANVKSIQGLT